jgi:hypothetical protein
MNNKAIVHTNCTTCFDPALTPVSLQLSINFHLNKTEKDNYCG